MDFVNPHASMTARRSLLVSFLIAALLLATLCVLFEPVWATNDDVAMSMIAHGYGIATYGSPQLVFSNVLWGYFIRALPGINGILGYTVATYAILFVIGWIAMYFLSRLNIGLVQGFLAVSLLLLEPVLFPQFTVNAGLLTVVAVLGWHVYARQGGTGNLVAASMLAFVGYLIRYEEFFFVLAIAMPAMPWRALKESRRLKVSLLVLGAAITLASLFDHWSYNGAEWQPFKEFNSARLPYTDYGAGEKLKLHPAIIERHGYTQNDMDLIDYWFFADPKIADPVSLKSMISELGTAAVNQDNLSAGWGAIKVLFNPVWLPLLLGALLLMSIVSGRVLVYCWILFLAALFVMGFMGRPGMLRVYVPVLTLLLLIPMTTHKFHLESRQWMITLLLVLACVGNAVLNIPYALGAGQKIRLVQHDLQSFPQGPVVIMGGESGFPFELAYPPFARSPEARKIKFYRLDTFMFAPYSNASAEAKAGNGLIESLQEPQGIRIVLSRQQYQMLQIYCREHYGGRLLVRTVYIGAATAVQQMRCDKETAR